MVVHSRQKLAGLPSLTARRTSDGLGSSISRGCTPRRDGFPPCHRRLATTNRHVAMLGTVVVGRDTVGSLQMPRQRFRTVPTFQTDYEVLPFSFAVKPLVFLPLGVVGMGRRLMAKVRRQTTLIRNLERTDRTVHDKPPCPASLRQGKGVVKDYQPTGRKARNGG